MKNAIQSTKPSTLQELDKFLDNFLMQYRNAIHATTRKTLAFLFKGRNFRTSASLDTTEVTFYKGSECRAGTGVALRCLGNKMLEIMDITDGSVHRRHIDQVHMSKPLEDDNCTARAEELQNLNCNPDVGLSPSQENLETAAPMTDQSSIRELPSNVEARPTRIRKFPARFQDYVA